jgi:hypothetical protein
MEVIKINSAGDNSWARKDKLDLKMRMIDSSARIGIASGGKGLRT